jgi:hypothetical protein
MNPSPVLTPPKGRDAHVEKPSEQILGFSLAERFEWLCLGSAARSFVELADGTLVNLSNVDGGIARISNDEGRTWTASAGMVDGAGPGRPTEDYECAPGLCTTDGVIVWVYRDFENKHWRWDDERGAPVGEARLDVWTIRSGDGGKTWTDRQKIFEGWCGCINGIIQTRRGNIVVPVQRLLHDPPRHAQCTYVSSDSGRTWQRSNIIDLGGYGHHDGCCEGSLVELKDGRLYMLMRTPLDRFWEAYSWDDGLSWRQIQPSDIPASSAPGYLAALASGRLVLVWNTLIDGAAPRPLHELRPSPDRPRKDWGSELGGGERWSRDALSIAWSDDEGNTWSEPFAFARGKRLCYPQILERRPGELWISFVAGREWTKNLVRVREEDL